jgi:hypothetical protein
MKIMPEIRIDRSKPLAEEPGWPLQRITERLPGRV